MGGREEGEGNVRGEKINKGEARQKPRKRDCEERERKREWSRGLVLARWSKASISRGPLD